MGDRRIIEFVAAGPKNYGLRHVNTVDGSDERMMCKVRGFELNSLACQSLNFETLKRVAFEKFQIDGHLYAHLLFTLFYLAMLLILEMTRFYRNRFLPPNGSLLRTKEAKSSQYTDQRSIEHFTKKAKFYQK